jgi:2-polyprenyl-3-methyl-5-hydroxy-6-metoxy-1,4-benzoquinol methylase
MVRLCMTVNKLFKLPVHPFNLHNEGKKTYAQWQYEKGIDTIKFYLKHTDVDEMFKDKVVLDIGCGAGGKTVFYASKGVKKIIGIEILEKYRDEAESLATEYGLEDKFEFVQGDASNMPFEDEIFNTIIMNDAMEHVDKPEKGGISNVTIGKDFVSGMEFVANHLMIVPRDDGRGAYTNDYAIFMVRGTYEITK